MPDMPSLTVERRPVPGTERALSALTILVDPPAVAPPSADARTVELLRRARERGVTTFDVADARFPERAERLIATAFPASDPNIAVIVGRSVDSLAKGRTSRGEPRASEDLAAALEESLMQSRRRLSPVPISVVEWDPDPGGNSVGPSIPPSLLDSPERPAEFVWAIRLASPATVLPETGRLPSLFTAGLSLLDREVVPLFRGTSGGPTASLIARDPFSDGRLDGSRFVAVTMLGPPGAGPVDVRHLQDEFAPVLALGFLTEGHRRTLAQAALRFVLGWPWVATAVIPLPTPERFEEILGSGASPAFSDEELTRLGLVK